MRSVLRLALPVLAFTLSGCLAVSLHPLYRDQETVYRPELVGRWSESGSSSQETWEITKSGDRAYTIVLTDEGKRGVFDGHLVMLGGSLFLDLYPADMDLPLVDVYEAHRAKVHSFLIVSQLTPTLTFAPFDDDWVKDLLKAEPNAIRHELVGDNLVLTASTSELQAFLIKHTKTAKAFGSPITLKAIR